VTAPRLEQYTCRHPGLPTRARNDRFGVTTCALVNEQKIGIQQFEALQRVVELLAFFLLNNKVARVALSIPADPRGHARTCRFHVDLVQGLPEES